MKFANRSLWTLKSSMSVQEGKHTVMLVPAVALRDHLVFLEFRTSFTECEETHKTESVLDLWEVPQLNRKQQNLEKI